MYHVASGLSFIFNSGHDQYPIYINLSLGKDGLIPSSLTREDVQNYCLRCEAEQRGAGVRRMTCIWLCLL